MACGTSWGQRSPKPWPRGVIQGHRGQAWRVRLQGSVGVNGQVMKPPPYKV